MREGALRLYIQEVLKDLEGTDEESGIDGVEESTGAGAVVGTMGPGWAEPKGFSLRSSKPGRHDKKSST